MKFVAVIICATFVLASGADDVTPVPASSSLENAPQKNKTREPEPSSVAPNPPTTPITTTTEKPTTQNLTTTEKPTTTAKPTTTEKPITTEKTTTTDKPTTTEKTTTTEKPPPDTTTTIAPLTTPKPAPTPVPQSGQWIVNGTNKTCIIVKMTTQFKVTYLSDNKTISRDIVLPRDNETFATGICNETEQVLNITWRSNESENNTLIFHFVVDGTKAYAIHHIEMYLAVKELPNLQSNNSVMFIHNQTEYKTGLGNSYRCGKLQRLSLNSTMMNVTGEIEVSDFQFQAFRTEKTKTFGAAEDCAVETQDVVPIAVGCSLIILVIIVLVAYLVGRRRRQAGGYLSM